jgi:hypothetical protein
MDYFFFHFKVLHTNRFVFAFVAPFHHLIPLEFIKTGLGRITIGSIKLSFVVDWTMCFALFESIWILIKNPKLGFRV